MIFLLRSSRKKSSESRRKLYELKILQRLKFQRRVKNIQLIKRLDDELNKHSFQNFLNGRVWDLYDLSNV